MEFELEGADRQQERIKREVGIVGILYEVGFTHFYLIHYSCKTNSTTTLLVRQQSHELTTCSLCYYGEHTPSTLSHYL